MNEAAEQALSNFRHEQALSIAHAKRADGYLNQFLSLVGEKGDRPTGMSIRCVREWTRWLADNGPALKSTVAEETGVRFTERGTAHTFLWDEDMADESDDAFPPNAIMRMQGPNDGRGRPPMIYFLWSQRWDVHPLFGVGPKQTRDSIEAEPSVTPENLGIGYLERVTQPLALTEEDEAMIADLLTSRYATMAEWDEAHGPLFDALVSADAKPSDEQKAMLKATLPEGEDANAAMAIAYRNAVRRSQEPSTLLGVVHPVSSHPIDPAYGEEQPLDWGT